MKLYDLTIVFICIILAAIAVGHISHEVTGEDDGIIEEACEEIILQVSGRDIDLTPESPEVKVSPTIPIN